MNRHLTFHEINALKAAIDFYIQNGPEKTQVADYSGSYPNGPEDKQFPKFDKRDFNNLKQTLENDWPETYKEYIHNFGLCCAAYDSRGKLVPCAGNRDDESDLRATIEAMESLTNELKAELEGTL